uniref:Reverse transcriptase-rnase h-integrase n=1 Tax=Moniliophthora roreri TaxID=221103 RepID=A0A0W0G904_MONRR
MAAEETDLDEQLKVAQQLLNPDPSAIPCRITRSRRRGALESLQESPEQAETEPEAKSSKADPLNEDRNIHHTPTPEMTTPGTSNAQDDVPDIVPKIEPETTETTDNANAQWARTISTAVIETINDKKDESSKGTVPESYKGEHSDTRHFLLDLELYFRMNLSRADMDEKKKMLLLSLVKGKRTAEWKMREQMRLFPENNPKEKRKVAEET